MSSLTINIHPANERNNSSILPLTQTPSSMQSPHYVSTATGLLARGNGVSRLAGMRSRSNANDGSNNHINGSTENNIQNEETKHTLTKHISNNGDENNAPLLDTKFRYSRLNLNISQNQIFKYT